MRVCQVSLALLVGVAIWSFAFAGDDGPVPVIPDTNTQFSLDMTVEATAEHDVVYAVEQRARPEYRIFSFDPSTGEDTTVFTVPDDAIIYGIALSPDRSTIAVAYSPDYAIDGSGLWLLDVGSSELTMAVDIDDGVYYVDPEWSSAGDAVLTTRVDRTTDDEQLAITEIDLAAGTAEILVDDAINPAAVGDAVYALGVDDDGARRSIALLDDGLAELARGAADLDHLVATDDGHLVVAAIDSTDTTRGLSFGAVADAHGNHNQPSTWWSVPLDQATHEPTTSEIPSIIVYDAAYGDDTIAYATAEGLSLADIDSNERIDLIASRAIRFVAA